MINQFQLLYQERRYCSDDQDFYNDDVSEVVIDEPIVSDVLEFSSTSSKDQKNCALSWRKCFLLHMKLKNK